MENNNIGRKCFIKDKDSQYYDEWGVIKHYDGELYHVAIANGTDSMPVFDRSQLRILKDKCDVNENRYR